ncbi:MAG: UDP-N-acetylmuramate dehydrogenase [Clostridiales bacterium]|nr:UDP-N-acetylmuramate dehydrogenase [Clostridiales bacterium]
MKNIKEIEIIDDADLKDFCTLKVGGKAKKLYIVYTIGQLLEVYYYIVSHNIRCKTIGLGSNLLFSSEGYDGAIIVNKSNNILYKKNTIYADSGVTLATLIHECQSRGLTGLENLAGIPSTVGGAVVNNTGAFGVEFGDCVEYVEAIYRNKTLRLTKEQCKFSYRTSIFKSGDYIITRVKLKLTLDSKENITDRMISVLRQKSISQPLDYPSAGSVFKRGEFIPAKVIDTLGLKGVRVGDAQISSKHAGFIINTGDASSDDILSLIHLINEKVKSVYDKTFDLEIEIVK